MNKLLTAGALAAALMIVPAAAHAQSTVRFSATLTGDNETPGLLTGAAGNVRIAADTVNREFTVDLSVYNLAANSTAAHIHVGPKGIAGPVIVDFAIPRGVVGDFVVTFRTGGGATFHARPELGINTFDDLIQAMMNGNAYVNVHTSANPAGEIRGQLEVVP